MKNAFALVLSTALLLPAVAGAATGAPEYIASPPINGKPAPFSEAVKAPPFLFLSGMIGIKPDGSGVVEGGIGPETQAALQNIKAAIEANGSSMDRVVKCTVFLADIKEWGAMNEVYVSFFAAGSRPARSALGTSGLALGARVEIECIALLK